MGTRHSLSLADSLASARDDALLVARAVVDRQDAEDVVQEAMARALRAAARGAVIDDPRAYLRAVVRNVAADHLRARAGEVPAAEVPERASRDGNPEAVFELREVLSAIDTLPTSQRRALLGTVLSRRDQQHLARLLQTTPAAVRQLVRRARHRLRDSVGGWLPPLAGRVSELLAACGPSGGARGGAVAVAIAAVVAPVAPAAPKVPAPRAPVVSVASPPAPAIAPPRVRSP
jgi:RNA polymerase sigma-70 factor (ECF subfamily)